MRRLVDADGNAPMEREFGTFSLTAPWPSARAARENRTITVTSLAQLAKEYGPEAVAAFTSLGLASAVCVPLPGPTLPLGALALGWDHGHEPDIMEQALLVSLAGYTARAVERALFVDGRVSAATQMQAALLTDLPAVPGLELAALYRPAADGELVGGDWYDAYPLPTPAQGGENSAVPAALAVSVGDITGHDLHAATLMGQARSMLRQADLDHAGQGPARAVTAFEHANAHLGINATGTLIHAHLRPCPAPDTGSWELTYTNAGHPRSAPAHPPTGQRRADRARHARLPQPAPPRPARSADPAGPGQPAAALHRRSDRRGPRRHRHRHRCRHPLPHPPPRPAPARPSAPTRRPCRRQRRPRRHRNARPAHPPPLKDLFCSDLP
ncbi:hypothetical protein C1N81_00105, partial (plasmid) [Streptomyces sp. SGAir0957]